MPVSVQDPARRRRARRAAPARRRVPRCVPGPGVCGAPVPGSGVLPAWCARMLPVPGACPACGTQSSRGNLQLAPVCILSQPNSNDGNRGQIRISQPNFQDLPAYFRENGEVAEFPGAMAAQPGGGWAPNLVERLMSAGQTRGRRAGVENVWRSGDPYLQCNVRLR